MFQHDTAWLAPRLAEIRERRTQWITLDPVDDGLSKIHAPYASFRNLCSERRLSGRGLSLKVCGQLVHDTSPT